MATETNLESKGRRISIDLTPAAAQEVDRLRERLDLTTADLFRYALHLIHTYVQERDRGNSFYIANADRPDENRSRLELAILSSSNYPNAERQSAKKR